MKKYQITTPEYVHFRYEIAGLFSRAMAWLVDQMILSVLRIAIQIIFIKSGLGLAMTGGASLYGLVVAMMFILVFVLDFCYFLVFDLWKNGQSPGKRLFQLRVISSRGGKLDFPDVLIRNLVRAVDTLPFAMLTGGLVAFFDPLHRRLGDFAAETLVIRDARISLPQAIVKQQARVNTFNENPSLRTRILSRVTREERDLILDLVTRRDSLDLGVREAIFKDAAGVFRTRYALPADQSHLSDEQTVINLALVLQEERFA
jgi:uncharacterized RDD family membrane protein YckC